MPNKQQPAKYRYFVCDLLTNKLLAEIPFKGVTYQRALKEAGAFSGEIPVLADAVDGSNPMDLYQNTMPGKTALYVVRDDKCVWGGIIWSRQYSMTERTLQVNASEFPSYFHHRMMWKTWYHKYSGKATITNEVISVELTDGSYNFSVGMGVRLNFQSVNNIPYDDFYKIHTTSDIKHFTAYAKTGMIDQIDNVEVMVRVDTYDYTRSLLEEVRIDFSDITFPTLEVTPDSEYFDVVVSVARSGNYSTVHTTYPHLLVPGQRFTLVHILDDLNTFEGSHVVYDVPSSTSFRYYNIGGDYDPQTPATVKANIVFKQIAYDNLNGTVETLTFDAEHPFQVDDTIYIENVDGYTDGYQVITAVSDDKLTISFPLTTALDATAAVPVEPHGTASLRPTLFYHSYGEFPNNSDLQIGYSTTALSGKNLTNNMYLGSQLKTVGDVLSSYAATVEGFEYRIDCAYDPNGHDSKFTRTFMLIPFSPPSLDSYLSYLPGGKLAVGDVAPPWAFGADKLVFEHPGNIKEMSIQESAEDTATRFWMQGNIDYIQSTASQPYVAASAGDLLAAGWPILEASDQQKDISMLPTGNNLKKYYNADLLTSYAEQMLAESRPPIASFTIKVNGSADPVVGSYAPGDWCTVITDDQYVKMRLASGYEIRNNVIMRKIDSYTVEVPDTPTAFSESVGLVLITEPQVDIIGN